MELLIAFVALSAMEIVLGIDNIVFIAILTGRLPSDRQALARRLGLALALVMRILLLLSLSWILKLTDPIFDLSTLEFLNGFLGEDHHEISEVSTKDLILFGGGLFLIWHSVKEIHGEVEHDRPHHHEQAVPVSFRGVLFRIAMMDVIFSLDSVITAVGMVKSEGGGLYVMIAAVMLAVGVMLVFAEQVSKFVAENPTLKMLALSFLILIGVLLVAEGIGTPINKGYVYFSMSFALVVEFLNLRVRKQHVASAS